MFPVIEDRPDGVRSEPDFVLYDSETCVLAEIKSGNNINGHDLKQMRKCADVDIEAAEDALKDAQVREKTGYDGTVSSVEPVIVYQDLDEEYIEEAYSASDSFQDVWDELTEYAVVMTQDYGDELRVLGGEFNDSGNLQSLLRGGIELPENPPDEIMLTEGMEHEVLAIAICDIWGEQAVDYDDGVKVTRTQVRDYFAPRHNVDLTDLEFVFKFLVEFEACDHVDSRHYKFTREHMSNILSVESQVMDESVEDYLHGPDQSSLDDHFGDDSDDSDDQ
ncbi:hypothetical protein HTG_10035 [Natrinema mahii]|nr:hypothetical protein HTG_10035 [Natrinema mahii]